MNEIVIRRAVSGDAEAMINIHRRSIQALCGDDYDEAQLSAWIGNRTAEDMVTRMRIHVFYFAELNGRQIGYAGYSLKSGELLSVFVDPDYARQGVATLMVRELFADAQRRGMESLWLDSSLTAVPFYEAVGFKGTEKTMYTFDNVPLECLRMELSLKD